MLYMYVISAMHMHIAWTIMWGLREVGDGGKGGGIEVEENSY